MEDEIRELIGTYKKLLWRAKVAKDDAKNSELLRWQSNGELRAYEKIIADLRMLLIDDERCGV